MIATRLCIIDLAETAVLYFMVVMADVHTSLSQESVRVLLLLLTA